MASKHILILEDHQTLAAMITELITINGWEVTLASNGRDGLEHAQKGGWTAIIADLKMPQMDGMEFLNALHENPPKIPNGPLVIYSNFAYGYAKDEALRRGAADFIAKDTMDSKTLVKHIEKLVAEQKAHVNKTKTP